jgi:outer membrane lipopolysaccharide assembly protein LptE/RlpB
MTRCTAQQDSPPRKGDLGPKTAVNPARRYTRTALRRSVSGWHQDYTAQELRTLYGNHARYVAKVASAETATATSNYLLWYDAAATVKEAGGSSVGR